MPACILPQGELREQAITGTKGLLPSTHRVIGFVTREMRLMVKSGNPPGLVALPQLLDPSVRLLFDLLLRRQQLDGNAINGYEHVEFTHAAVAA